MTTGSVTSTEGQEARFTEFVQEIIGQACKKVPMDKEALQRLFGNGGKVQDEMIATLIKYSAADNRFELLNTFELTVPQKYTHGTQLATFAEFAKDKSKKFYDYNKAITDENFAGATKQLVPGKTYGVKIFGIKQRVTSEDCMAFLASQHAILVGAQGLSLTRQLKKDEFPVGKWTTSFDEKDALWTDAGGDHRVPRVGRDSGGDWRFDLGFFESDWLGDDCLLCFCDLP